MKDKIFDYPTILSLSPNELIDWCNTRKKEMHLSNAKLANMTNVPEGTIDRILTGKNPEFRYSTIQPIVKLLIGFNEDTPNNESTDYYTNTIDGYKLIVKDKNHVINELKESYQILMNEKEYLKKSNDEKQKIIESLTKHIDWLEGIVDNKKKTKA